ncbi:MAG: ATP-binding cassette domain-containing protein [Rhodocyclaceae bacterium]
MASLAIELRDVAFTWPGQPAPCLRVAHLAVPAGAQLFVGGPSGSGKSTLLSLVGGVLVPQTGSVTVLGQSLAAMSAAARDRFRGDHIGFVFQQFNLVPYLSVLDNVLLPCRFSALRRMRSAEQGATPRLAAQALLARLDLADDLWGRPAMRLSVGQQQRVAAARALIGRPALVVADEPTSALDAARQAAFLDLLRRECADAGSSLLFVSHDTRLAEGFTARLSFGEAA